MHEHVFVLSPEIEQNYPWWDEEAEVSNAINRLDELKANGIDTIVDLTVTGLGRYIPRIQRINAETDINIVAATGLYTYNDVPHYFHFRGPGTLFDGPEPMVEMFVGDIQDGIAGTGVKAAILKCATDEPGDGRGGELRVDRGSVTGRAVVERRTIHIEDVAALPEEEFPETRAVQQRFGQRTTLATPLLREGQALGAILIRRTEVKPFTNEQIALLETFADQAVIAIENVRLFNELRERTAELTRSVGELRALGDVGRALSSTLDLDTVLQTIVTRASQLAGGRRLLRLRVRRGDRSLPPPRHPQP